MNQAIGNRLLLPRVQYKDPTIATLKMKTNTDQLRPTLISFYFVWDP